MHRYTAPCQELSDEELDLQKKKCGEFNVVRDKVDVVPSALEYWE